MPPKKLTANSSAPLRYRPGKAVGQIESSESESESDSEAEDSQQAQEPKQPAPQATSFPRFNLEQAAARKAAAAAAQAKESEQKAIDDGFVTASEDDESSADDKDSDASDAGADDIESSDEQDSSEETDSESDRPNLIAPTFISKARRTAAATKNLNHTASKDREEQDRRLRQEKADALLQAQLDRDAQARAQGRKAFDDDDEAAAGQDDLNDADGQDPAAEHAAWKLRELSRVKRDRDALIAADKAAEDLEKLRNMTPAERAALDEEHLAAQKAKDAAKGSIGFMQKYHHRGAFFQDEEGLQDLKARDLMGARYADDAGKEILPEYMQIRDMTQLGKRSRTKYKDMKTEDTGSWGADARERRGPGDGYGRRHQGADAGPTGANSHAVGERRSHAGDADERTEKRARYT